MVEFENTDEFGVAVLGVLNPPRFSQVRTALHQSEGVHLDCANGRTYTFLPRDETPQSMKDRLYNGVCFDAGKDFETTKRMDAKLHLQEVEKGKYFSELQIFTLGLH